MQVDVAVLDDRRMPVRGLKPSDFTLFEDGAPREIVAFTEMTGAEGTYLLSFQAALGETVTARRDVRFVVSPRSER